MKTTLIAISIAAAILFSSGPADARKPQILDTIGWPQILRDTKGYIGWRYYKKTKSWKRIRVSKPGDGAKRHRDLYIKEYRRKQKEKAR